jgi:hypothetical protein
LEHLLEFSRELIDELMAEAASAEVLLDDLAFERLCSTLEAEGEIEASDRCAFRPFQPRARPAQSRSPTPSEGAFAAPQCQSFRPRSTDPENRRSFIRTETRCAMPCWPGGWSRPAALMIAMLWLTG